MKAATSAVKAGPRRELRRSLRGWGNPHPIWGEAAHGVQRGEQRFLMNFVGQMALTEPPRANRL